MGIDISSYVATRHLSLHINKATKLQPPTMYEPLFFALRPIVIKAFLEMLIGLFQKHLLVCICMMCYDVALSQGDVFHIATPGQNEFKGTLRSRGASESISTPFLTALDPSTASQELNFNYGKDVKPVHHAVYKLVKSHFCRFSSCSWFCDCH